jgi:hypothetical protein
MTLGEAITLVLQRTGLSITVTANKNQARTYLSLSASEHLPLVPWWFLDRTTTFATVAATRSYQPISGQVTAWWSFVDETNDRPLEIVGPDAYDLLDPDRTRDGSAYKVHIAGLDATTGYPVVDLWYTPDSVATIRVRYRMDINVWSSSNDASDLTVLGLPRILHSALLYDASAKYMEENGDDTGSDRERQNHNRAVRAAKRQNLLMQGNRSDPPNGNNNDPFGILLGTSLVTG